jgi:hypothetical protein
MPTMKPSVPPGHVLIEWTSTLTVDYSLPGAGAGDPPSAGAREEPAAYSYDQVATAVSAGADLVTGGLGISGSGADLADLVARAALALLRNPGITELDEVIRASYDDPPEKVRGWWNGWH